MCGDDCHGVGQQAAEGLRLGGESKWSVISPKVTSTGLRHSAMIFGTIGGLV